MEHVLEFTSSPEVKLHHATVSKVLAKLVVCGFGEMRWRRKDVAVGRALRIHRVADDGFNSFGPKLLLTLALNHP